MAAANTQGLDLLVYLDVVSPEIVAHTAVLVLIWVLLVPYNTYRIVLRRNEYGFALSSYVTYMNVVVLATLVGSGIAFFFNRNRGAGNLTTLHGQIGGAVTGVGLALALGFFPRTLGRLALLGGIAALATGFDSTVVLFGANDQLNVARLGTLGLFALFLLFLLRAYQNLAPPPESADRIPGVPAWARRITAGGGARRSTGDQAAMPQPALFQRFSARLFGGPPDMLPPLGGERGGGGGGDGYGGGYPNTFQRFAARLSFGGGNMQAVQPYSGGGGASFPGAFDDPFKPAGQQQQQQQQQQQLQQLQQQMMPMQQMQQMPIPMQQMPMQEMPRQQMPMPGGGRMY
jgi:hypothetical protein